jgi:hypothetical protein
MSILVSTSYLPPISIISACLGSEKVIIEGFETYTKQTCRNHCVIYGPNGPQILSIPVYKVYGNHTMVKDIQISYSSPWQKIHWRSIETAYNNSPFFLYYRDHFEPFYRKRIENLLEFNTELLKVIFNLLGLEKKIGFTDHYMSQPEEMTNKRSLVNKKMNSSKTSFPEYQQTFNPKFGFLPNLSVIDLLFNLGPEAADYLLSLPAVNYL